MNETERLTLCQELKVEARKHRRYAALAGAFMIVLGIVGVMVSASLPWFVFAILAALCASQESAYVLHLETKLTLYEILGHIRYSH